MLESAIEYYGLNEVDDAMNNQETETNKNKINLEYYFDYVEVESDYLINLLHQVIQNIIDSGFQEELSFGPIIEGFTYCKEAGEVTEDNDIRINSKLLIKYEDDVAMAIIAHELAHSFLKHFERYGKGLENEYEADNLAKEWGFAIDKFRQVCGPPTIQG